MMFSVELTDSLHLFWVIGAVHTQNFTAELLNTELLLDTRTILLRFYGHVVSFTEGDPAHRSSAGWNRRRGRPRASWLSHL